VLRWVNLALAVVLATLLLTELLRSREPAPAGPTISTAPPVVAEERPGRRSRRMERQLAMEEARRRQRVRPPGAGGPPEFDFGGKPIRD
jgi:hypothetical protein